MAHITCTYPGQECNAVLVSPKVVRYLGKQRHRFMQKLHSKNGPKNMGGIKLDFTAIPPTETYISEESSGAAEDSCWGKETSQSTYTSAILT